MANDSKRAVVATPHFERALYRYVRRNSSRQDRVADALQLLAENMNDPRLKTHRLGGGKHPALACSCGYDCRIVFSVETDAKTKTEKIILADVGTHGEVY